MQAETNALAQQRWPCLGPLLRVEYFAEVLAAAPHPVHSESRETRGRLSAQVSCFAGIIQCCTMTLSQYAQECRGAAPPPRARLLGARAVLAGRPDSVRLWQRQSQRVARGAKAKAQNARERELRRRECHLPHGRLSHAFVLPLLVEIETRQLAGSGNLFASGPPRFYGVCTRSHGVCTGACTHRS